MGVSIHNRMRMKTRFNFDLWYEDKEVIDNYINKQYFFIKDICWFDEKTRVCFSIQIYLGIQKKLIKKLEKGKYQLIC